MFIRMLRSKRELFPGIVGYEKTVIPAPRIVNAILSKHDFIFWAFRQGKRPGSYALLVRFLDERVPAIAARTPTTIRSLPSGKKGRGDHRVR